MHTHTHTHTHLKNSMFNYIIHTYMYTPSGPIHTYAVTYPHTYTHHIIMQEYRVLDQ